MATEQRVQVKDDSNHLLAGAKRLKIFLLPRDY